MSRHKGSDRPLKYFRKAIMWMFRVRILDGEYKKNINAACFLTHLPELGQVDLAKTCEHNYEH